MPYMKTNIKTKVDLAFVCGNCIDFVFLRFLDGNCGHGINKH